MPETFRIVAKTFVGLERVLAGELAELGAADAVLGNRMVSFLGDRRTLYRANLWCRTAVRMLRPVHSFVIADGDDPAKSLYAGTAAVDWSAWLDVAGTLAIDAIVPRQLFANSMFAALVTKDAIVDQFRERTGVRPNVDRDRPDLRIHLHIAGHEVTLYLDSSGDSLHRRGYRRVAGEAPLNEVLAAGLVRLSGWQADLPLVDFMCGSGTIAIEAAMLARNMAPGLVRGDFGFMRWPDFDRKLYDELVAEARSQARSYSPAPIFASDVDDRAIAAARGNAERAGVAADIHLATANFEAIDPPAPAGVVLVNPPYDERMHTRHIGAFYRRLGQVLRRSWPRWQIHVLSGFPAAAEEMGLRPRRAVRLFNGPIECRLITFDGSADKPPRNSATRQGESEETLRTAMQSVAATTPPHPNQFSAGEGSASLLVPAKWRAQSAAFTNRLARMARHWQRVARRNELQAVRLYDRDIPEIPLSVEWYAGHVHVVEHDRPHDRAAVEHEHWLAGVLDAIAATLDVPRQAMTVDCVHGGGINRPSDRPQTAVAEGPCHYFVDLADGQPTGLAIDERGLRASVLREATGKRFLSLFAACATLSVAAAAGGAASTLAVEQERTWLRLALANLNGGPWRPPAHRYLTADPAEFLATSEPEAFDLVCVTPPPGFGVSPDRPPWDVRPAYVELLTLLAPSVAPGGQVYVASRAGRPVLQSEDLPQYTLRNVSRKLAAPDCRRGPRFWSLFKTDGRIEREPGQT